MRRALVAAIAAVSAVSFTFGTATVASAQEDKTIVEIAAANPDFSTLVKAVTAAELAETLSGPGPFTVFAPTNKAFEALPAGTLDTLLKDPKGDLAKILKLHVISGAVDAKAATAAAGTNVETLGGPVAVKADGSKLTFGGANVVTTDIKAKNGIIHVIDAVVTAPAEAAQAGESTEAAQAGESTEAAQAGESTEAAEIPEATEATEATEVAPERVDTGDSGLAASSDNNVALLSLAVLGAAGVVASTLVLARRRRAS